NIVYNFFSREIEDKLMSGTVRTPSRNHECPVRMLTVEITVLVHHLRLDPDTELQTHSIDLGDQLSKAAAQLFLIDFPVSQSSQLAVALSEPSIVHDKHLDSQIRRLFCKLEQTISRKIEVGRLPAIQEDRAHRFFIFSSAEMCADTAVKILRKLCKTFGGITHKIGRA